MLAPSKSEANQEACRVLFSQSVYQSADTKVKGTRLVIKALWTIVGTNVYMIDSQLLNVQSPKPTLSSLMLRLIARVRALT